MSKNLRFWTNVGVIGFAHLAVIYGLFRWSRDSNDGSRQSVVWLNGAAGDAVATQKRTPAAREKPSPRIESKDEKSRDEEEDRPLLTSAPSEIQLPRRIAGLARTPSPAPTATPRPTASVKGTPKHKPKSTPKPTPKPAKPTLAETKPSAKPKREEKEETSKRPESADLDKKKTVLAKNEVPPSKLTEEQSSATQTAAGKGSSPGSSGGRAGGSVNESQFGWYGSMLHDRFYSEWAQPTSVANAAGKNSVLVKLRIEKDGRVSSFEIVRSSGTAELDDSVKALSNRVSQVEPLPDGLGKGDHYDVKINFELNSQ